VLTHEDAIACGVVGPVARASGVDYDVRVVAPYSVYDRLPVDVLTLSDGDVWSRAMVRLHEVLVAIDLIRRVLKEPPAGAININD
ncbi:hypothetical protein J8J40_31730, partial [Mycobacterium tuberculosis]|nr:hypothetical protein [Mycobacterium tuberculosis]